MNQTAAERLWRPRRDQGRSMPSRQGISNEDRPLRERSTRHRSPHQPVREGIVGGRQVAVEHDLVQRGRSEPACRRDHPHAAQREEKH